VLAPQTDRERLQTLAQRIIDRLKTPFRIGLIEVYTGCSIGIALCPEHGKRTYTVFSPEMNKRVAEYMWLDTNLRKGLEQNQLVLYYQPKIDARSGEVHSVEALVRWDSPERGLIPPLQFISYAEESGLIGPLGQWVLQTAAGQAAQWQEQGLNLRVAVNLSARQLADDGIVNELLAVLRRHRMAPCLLDFELTESSLIEDENRAR
jgi:cyclic di-GMP phosphodiesterase Gmr